MADASIDAIISDPPYGTGANTASGRLSASSSKYRNSDAAPLPDIAGDSMLPEAWQAMMRAVLSECYRVAKPGCDLLYFCDWRSMPSMLSLIGSVGFGVRGALVWNKGRGSRPSRNGFRSQCEFVLWGRKSGKLNRAADVYLDGCFQHSTLTTKNHLTEKPLALMRDLIRIVPPGGTVLDPFQGAGTTGRAALEADLTYIGIEAVEHYHALATRQLTESTAKVA